MTTAYTVKIVEQDGAGGFSVVRTITKPVFSSPPTKVRNGMGSMGMQFGRSDPALADLAAGWPSREVQVYRGSSTTPWWWGVAVHPAKEVGGPLVTVQFAESIPWLLSRRFFGKASRDNLLANPSFETGDFTGWTTTGVDTATVDNSDSALGAYSAKLVEASTLPDASVQQSFSFTAGGVGNILAFAAWFDITSFTGPAYASRGLHVEWLVGGVVQQGVDTIIDSTTPGGWQRADLGPGQSIAIPPSVAATVNVRGYAIKGTIRWDAFQAVAMESLSTSPSGTDIASFAAAIVNHAQDAAYAKDDAYIGVYAPSTGYLLPFFAYQFAEHANIWTGGIGDLVSREDGIDVGYDYTATTRTLHVYDRTAGAAGIGADNTALDMSIGGPYLLDYGWERDGGAAANSIVMLGDGTGPEREEAAFTDPSAYGGRTLEAVVAAPPGTPISQLDQRARRAGAKAVRIATLNLKFKPGLLIEGGTTVGLGDTLTLPAYDGFVDAGDYRVVDLALDPSKDVLTAGVSPA